MSKDNKLIEVIHLKKYFPVRKGVFSRTKAYVQAVDDVSFNIRPGETLGLVGESGCGKTTLGRTIIRLLEPTGGDVRFQGRSILPVKGKQLRHLRAHMQVIFQDPFGSLNPRMTVETIVGEALSVHKIASGRQRQKRVIELLERVGLSRAHLRNYPHEFSGGQRQRIGIARALALQPDFVVCDEPVSALDVSIQAQIINLLVDLQREFNLSYLFIAHDLNVVQHTSDRVAVMYLGKIVESASSTELYRTPLHPYTRALLSAIPVPDPKSKHERIILKGDVPSPINPPSGCRFHTRCPDAFAPCSLQEPPFEQVTDGHWVACWLHTDWRKYRR